jgi:hypothetical protein
MAYEYLVRQLNPLQAAAELVRFRDAAQRLIRFTLGTPSYSPLARISASALAILVRS